MNPVCLIYDWIIDSMNEWMNECGGWDEWNELENVR